jgi:hypothetical protein
LLKSSFSFFGDNWAYKESSSEWYVSLHFRSKNNINYKL